MVKPRETKLDPTESAKEGSGRTSGKSRRGRPQSTTVSPLGQLILEAMDALNLTYKQIVESSRELAELYQNDDMVVAKSTVGNIISGRIRQPSAAKLDSLSIVLKLSRRKIDSALGLAPERRLTEQLRIRIDRTHEVEREAVTSRRMVRVPILRRDANLTTSYFLNGVVEHWAVVDIGYLASLYPPNLRYFVVGETDRFPSPILPPGTKVLVNTHLTMIVTAENRSYHQRELYCVKTARGLICSFLESAPGSRIVLVPHPQSGYTREEFPSSEVTVVGQVVGFLLPTQRFR